jgi:hypothetical protein
MSPALITLFALKKKPSTQIATHLIAVNFSGYTVPTLQFSFLGF